MGKDASLIVCIECILQILGFLKQTVLADNIYWNKSHLTTADFLDYVSKHTQKMHFVIMSY